MQYLGTTQGPPRTSREHEEGVQGTRRRPQGTTQERSGAPGNILGWSWELQGGLSSHYYKYHCYSVYYYYYYYYYYYFCYCAWAVPFLLRLPAVSHLLQQTHDRGRLHAKFLFVRGILLGLDLFGSMGRHGSAVSFRIPREQQANTRTKCKDWTIHVNGLHGSRHDNKRDSANVNYNRKILYIVQYDTISYDAIYSKTI